MADPDFELSRGHGSILLAQPASLPSVISSFFTQNKGEGVGVRAPQALHLDPPLGIQQFTFCYIRLGFALIHLSVKNCRYLGTSQIFDSRILGPVCNFGSFCRYRKALYFGSLRIILYLELFCFLFFISFVLRKLK